MPPLQPPQVIKTEFEFTTNIDQYKLSSDIKEWQPRKFAVTVYNGLKVRYSADELEKMPNIPVVIFSPGHSDKSANYEENIVLNTKYTKDDGVYVIEDEDNVVDIGFFSKLAEAGYVVVAMEHPYIDEVVEIEGKEILIDMKFFNSFNFTPFSSNTKSTRYRARDISCFIDMIKEENPTCDTALISGNKAGFDSIFKDAQGLYLPNKIAVIGHSMGGTAAQLMVSDTTYNPNIDQHSENPFDVEKALKNPSFDSRVSAAINYDGANYLNYPQAGKLKAPLLHMPSEGGWQHPIRFWDTYYMTKSRLEFNDNGYAVIIKDSTHYSSFWNNRENVFNKRHRELTTIHTDVFLSKYLKDTELPMYWDHPEYEVFFRHSPGENQRDYSIDSDNDGISDGDEILILQQDPESADSDNDGANDGVEYLILHDLQLVVDTDGDDFGDSVLHDDDNDDDKLTKTVEDSLGTSDWNKDSDGDNVCDRREVLHDNTNPDKRRNFNWLSALFIGCN